jgi:hypothetical protein
MVISPTYSDKSHGNRAKKNARTLKNEEKKCRRGKKENILQTGQNVILPRSTQEQMRLVRL